MADLLANALLAYAGIMLFGFGGIVASTATGPLRLLVVAVTLMMVAAPYGQIGGPRI